MIVILFSHYKCLETKQLQTYFLKILMVHLSRSLQTFVVHLGGINCQIHLLLCAASLCVNKHITS